MAFGNKQKQDAANSGMTIIAAGSRLTGDLDLQNALHIDGSLRGTVASSSNISIGTSGHFTGTITAKQILICGTVEGDLDCERVEIARTGKLIGDLVCDELVIESGARFFGSSRPRVRAADDAAERTAEILAEPEPAGSVPEAAEAPAPVPPTRIEPVLAEASTMESGSTRTTAADAAPAASNSEPASNDPILDGPTRAEPVGHGRWRVAPRPAASSDYR